MRVRNWLAVGILVGAAGGCGSSGRGMGGDDPAIASDKAAINNTRTRTSPRGTSPMLAASPTSCR